MYTAAECGEMSITFLRLYHYKRAMMKNCPHFHGASRANNFAWKSLHIQTIFFTTTVVFPLNPKGPEKQFLGHRQALKRRQLS
jgi:hypothetical protein